MEEGIDKSESKIESEQTSMNLGTNMSHLSHEENPYQTDTSQHQTADKFDKDEIRSSITHVCLT